MMAAHRVAAASGAPAVKPNCSALRDSLNSSFATNVKYSPAELYFINNNLTASISPAVKATLGRLGILRTQERCGGARGRTGKRKRCARRQKRGKRAGWLTQLKSNKPPIPSLFLANVRSLDNKIDTLRLQMRVCEEMRNCCVVGLTETWLNNNMPDSAFQIDGLQLFRADRDHRSGKTRGGGLCVYVNKGWCTNNELVKSYCSEAIEHVTVKCRPHYLPREFTAVFVCIVYIPPGANANANGSEALRELHNTVSSLQSRHPEAFYVVAGDFNHVKLTDTLPSFYQHVTIPTRGDNTLDCVYTNLRGAYRSLPRPHLGLSDHISILMAPAYRPRVKSLKPVRRTVTVWPQDAAPVLQDCFQHTDWRMFREAATQGGEVNLEEYTSSVLGFISKCADDVTITRQITVYPNQKPWLNAEVRALLKARDAAFRAGEAEALRAARRALDKGIKGAKSTYAKKIQGHLTSGDPRSMWKGIKCITNFNNKNAQGPTDPSLADALNKFYARFEDPNTPPSTKLTPPPDDTPLSVTTEDVRRTLQKINPHKAAGPDGVPGRVLKDCSHQLAEVLTDIFNTSLQLATVPSCLKSATIVPVPKGHSVKELNDYRPVALTPIVMKCFEKLVMAHIRDSIDITVDPHQYAYRRNRSTDDAVSSVVHTSLTHLESKDSYIRLLFLDFTSAFNTIIPQTLVQKLTELGLSATTGNWVLDFLADRSQTVRINNTVSSPITISTGSPQGCVLSPLLFTLLTYDCSAKHPSCHIVKFADDTVVVGRIRNDDESKYREEVEHLVHWCRRNNLCINVGKTKEMVVDFRRKRPSPPPLHIGGAAVEVVSSYRYLGVHLTDDLTWSCNTSYLLRKAHQRLYFLRKLRRAGLGSAVLKCFYRGAVESILTTSITVWHGSCSAADRKALQRVVKAAQRTVGGGLPTTTEIYTSRCRRRATHIMTDPTHPAHCLFQPLPSGRRLRSIRSRTTRLRNSFFPEAVRQLNSCGAL